MEVKDLKQIFICHLFEPKQKAYLTLFAESVDESFDVGPEGESQDVHVSLVQLF
jgi:hypothetical protein